MRRVLVSSLVLVLSAQVFSGNLEPAAAPGSTMKTLDEVEPRIPISQADIPKAITQSGSYYLTENVTSTNTALTIDVDDVTIDLMGYKIDGLNSTSFGIYMIGRTNVEIRNGTICNFTNKGILLNNFNLSSGCRFISLRVSNTGTTTTESSIYLLGRGHLIKDCTLVGNKGSGLKAGHGARVVGNAIYNNGGHGIEAAYGCTISNNSVHMNGGRGISASQGSTIVNNSSYGNGDHGIYAYYGCVVKANTVFGNQADGIYANIGTTVIGNSSFDNKNWGIYLTGRCLVDQNTSYSNNKSGGAFGNMNSPSTGTFGNNYAP